MKKTIALTLALVIALCVLLSGCGNNSTKEAQSGAVNDVGGNGDSLGVQSDIKIDKDASAEEVSISENDLSEQVRAFAKNVYYLEGALYSGGDEGMPLKLAANDKDMQMETTAEGLNIGFILLDSQKYILLPSKKEYTELNDTFTSMLGLDVSLDELNSITASEDQISEANEKKSKVTINGKAGYCITFDFSDTVINVYTYEDGSMVQVDYFDDGSSSPTMQIVIDSFSLTIPADKLTLKDKTSVSTATFVKDLSAMAVDAAGQN